MAFLQDIPFSSVVQSPDVQVILTAMILSTIIAGAISQLYKYTHRGMNFELSFMSTLVLLAPIVSLVMLFIRGDLVLSLGLIGSLSIIRFRTPIKDTRDMVYLFWIIVVGLGCGTYNWMSVILASMFIFAVVLTLYWTRYGRSENSDYILIVAGRISDYKIDIEKIVQEYVEELKVRSYEVEDESWEVVFELKYSRVKGKFDQKMLSDLRNSEGVEKVSLLAPQIALPV